MDGEAWVQAYGTFVTIAGLVVVAPRAAGKALPDLWHWARWPATAWVRRVILRRRPRTHYATVQGDIKLGGYAEAKVTEVAPGDGASDAERLAYLMRGLSIVRGEVDALRADMRAQLATVSERVAKVESSHAAVAAAVEADRQATEAINGRGFPLAAAGALLAGTPFWFASWWWSPLFALVGVVALVWLLGARHDLHAGWRNHGPV